MASRKRPGLFNAASASVVSAACALIAFIVGTGLNSFIKLGNIATVPYVDSKHDESTRYTDKSAALVLDKAFEHSDMNRKAMELNEKELSSDVRALGAKLDIMLEMMRAKVSKR